MECDDRTLLLQRLEDEGFEIAYNPRDDGMCFYASVGHQLGLSANTVQNMIFEYLLNHRYDVSNKNWQKGSVTTHIDLIPSMDTQSKITHNWFTIFQTLGWWQ